MGYQDAARSRRGPSSGRDLWTAPRRTVSGRGQERSGRPARTDSEAPSRERWRLALMPAAAAAGPLVCQPGFPGARGLERSWERASRQHLLPGRARRGYSLSATGDQPQLHLPRWRSAQPAKGFSTVCPLLLTATMLSLNPCSDEKTDVQRLVELSSFTR